MFLVPKQTVSFRRLFCLLATPTAVFGFVTRQSSSHFSTTSFLVSSALTTYARGSQPIVGNTASAAERSCGTEKIGTNMNNQGKKRQQLSMSSSSTEEFYNSGNVGKEEKESLSPSLKSWRSYMEVSIATSRKIRGSNYVQLATTDQKTNEPRVRTVVFRGFSKFPTDHASYNSSVCSDGQGDDDTKKQCVFKMCTDARSNKVQEVARKNQNQQINSDNGGTDNGDSNVAEIVWWFPKTSEQYRIRGHLEFTGNGGTNDQDTFLMLSRKELWGNLSDPSRESFLTTKAPGSPYSEEEEATSIPSGGRDEDGKVVPVPENFLLMLLRPTFVDYLNLSTNYRQIDEFKNSNGVWSSKRVNA